MKKFLTIIITFTLFLSCGAGHDHPQQEPEPEEPVEAPYEMPCSCLDEWIYQEETACQQELAWDYPVKIGSEEGWNQFQTQQELLDACQIPEDILVSLSTEDLTEICMQYPFFVSTVFSHDHVEWGVIALFDEFNGVRELFQREDLSKGLSKWHSCTMLKLLDETISKEQEALLCIYVYCWEVLVIRCQFQDKKEYIEILKHLFCGYEKHVLYRWDDLGSQSFTATIYNFFARGRIIAKIDEHILEESLKELPNDIMPLFYYGFVNENSMRIINELTCQLIK